MFSRLSPIVPTPIKCSKTAAPKIKISPERIARGQPRRRVDQCVAGTLLIITWTIARTDTPCCFWRNAPYGQIYFSRHTFALSKSSKDGWRCSRRASVYTHPKLWQVSKGKTVMGTYSWHIAVLIPARNEEKLLPNCLLSVERARANLPFGVTSDLIVVADSCTDNTYSVACKKLVNKGLVAKSEAGMVGTARALASTLALSRHKGSRRRCWLANTDADCEVPEDWLFKQLELARQGIEAVAGLISVDSFAEHLPHVATRFRETYRSFADGTHPHVHGANLGIRADSYEAVGGWHDLATAEDHHLWNRLVAKGRVCRSVAQLSVMTSGRRVGRAPHGFAEALAAHNSTDIAPNYGLSLSLATTGNRESL
jgi:hypothetical protein